MKKVLMITDVDFWKPGAGHRMRISKVVEFLSVRTTVTIVYIGLAIPRQNDLPLEPNYEFIFWGEEQPAAPNEYVQRLSDFIKNKHFDFCIIEYIHNAYLLAALPEEVKTILDAHDIISERAASFKEFGYENTLFELPTDLEIELFDVFDHLMLICEPDYQKLKDIFSEDKVLLCPHPSSLCRHEIRTSVKNIGFIGSEYLPNVDAVNFFIKKCWPAIARNHDVRFSVYGNVCSAIRQVDPEKNIHLAGYIANIVDVYNQLDIVVNPVRFGAGLKIKTIEALANGLPLVTSSHGARGLDTNGTHAFWIANSPEDFIFILNDMIEHPGIRKETASEAYSFAEENFSPEKCFQPLMKVINA